MQHAIKEGWLVCACVQYKQQEMKVLCIYLLRVTDKHHTVKLKATITATFYCPNLYYCYFCSLKKLWIVLIIYGSAFSFNMQLHERCTQTGSLAWALQCMSGSMQMDVIGLSDTLCHVNWLWNFVFALSVLLKSQQLTPLHIIDIPLKQPQIPLCFKTNRLPIVTQSPLGQYYAVTKPKIVHITHAFVFDKWDYNFLFSLNRSHLYNRFTMRWNFTSNNLRGLAQHIKTAAAFSNVLLQWLSTFAASVAHIIKDVAFPERFWNILHLNLRLKIINGRIKGWWREFWSSVWILMKYYALM